MIALDVLHHRATADRALALRLVSDLDDETASRFASNGSIVNHPAWTLRHLTGYDDVIECMVLGRDVPDPAGRPFGNGSKPVEDAAVYGSLAEIRADFDAAWKRVIAALTEADGACLTEPVPVARWRDWMPTRGHMLNQLVVTHPAWHLAQLGTWRRASGLAALPPDS